jgi:hypothetical protein
MMVLNEKFRIIYTNILFLVLLINYDFFGSKLTILLFFTKYGSELIFFLWRSEYVVHE